MEDKNTKMILDAINEMKINIDERFNLVDKKFDSIDIKFESFDRKFDSIDRKFDSIDAKFDSIDGKFDSIDGKFASIDAHLNSHDKYFKEIKEELASLGNTVTRMETELGTKAQIGLEYASISMEKFDNLQKTVDKINSKLNTHDLHIEILEEKAL